MTDRPILFSAPMVRALLAGSKTQTRRILKPQPYSNGHHFDGRDILCHIDELPPAALLMDKGKGKNRYTVSNFEDGPEGFADRYIGDRLWVREAWAPLDALTHNDPGVQALADRGFYRADGGTVEGEISRWRPSIHMPRWASRLTLTVTDVRVERLQDISEIDALAEGAYVAKASGRVADNYVAMAVAGEWFATGRAWYENLWDRINGPCAWTANPFVAAYSFTVEHANIDALANRPVCEEG